MITGRKIIDITGKKFGKWTAVELAQRCGAKRSARFLCLYRAGVRSANLAPIKKKIKNTECLLKGCIQYGMV